MQDRRPKTSIVLDVATGHSFTFYFLLAEKSYVRGEGKIGLWQNLLQGNKITTQRGVKKKASCCFTVGASRLAPLLFFQEGEIGVGKRRGPFSA